MPELLFNQLDMRDINVSDLLEGDIENATSTYIEVIGDDFIVEFVGTGFTYSGEAVTGGTVTELYVNGDYGFAARGLSTSAAQLYNWIINGQTAQALAGLFAGNDTFTGDGSGGGNYINGYAGNDFLNPGGGSDTMLGGLGNDIFIVQYSGSADTVVENAGEGIDEVRSYVSSYTLPNNIEYLRLMYGAVNGTGNTLNNLIEGNSGANTLSGLAGDDLLGGLGGDDTLYGGAGNDILYGHDGRDVSYGGAGDDLFYINQGNDEVIENAGEGFDKIVTRVSYTLPSNVEWLAVEAGYAATLTSRAAGGELLGANGNDTLIGLGGADRLRGAGGDDILRGGGGVDTAVYLGAFSAFTMTVVDGALRVSGGTSGTDTLTDVEFLQFDDYRIDANIYFGDTVVQGTAQSETLFGGDFDDTLNGGAGNDVLNGGAGEDRMTGGTGNDYYVMDDRGDRVIEGANGGLDVVRTRVTYSMQENIENLVMFGTGNIGAIGNGLNNRIIGNEGNNVIKGGLGADRLEGGDGNDNYLANIEDQIIELANGGIDLIRTSDSWTLGTHFENLTLIGSSNTFGGGNARANVIEGNRGNNTIYGGALGDTLKGGDGVDRFLYTAASDSTAANADRILDLRGNEIIDLRGVDANSSVAGDQAFVIVDAFTNVAGQMTVTYDAASQTSTARMDINGDGVADMAIIMNGDKEDFAGWWL